MSKQKKPETENGQQYTRRDFLKASSAVLVSAVAFNTLAGCSNEAKTVTATKTATSTTTKTITSLPTTVVTTVAPTTVATTTEPATVTKPATHEITDMAGRKVTLPTDISRIGLVGAVPVMFGFMFAMGQASKLVNTSTIASIPGHKYDYVLAPNLLNAPINPPTESLILLEPDVVFTMSMETVTTLENAGLNVVYLSWTNTTDVFDLMNLLGQIFGEEARAAAYIEYFDDTVARLTNLVSAIPETDRVTALYGKLSSLSNPHLISEWWIEKAGGISVTKELHTGATESITYSLEDLLKWDPQVIISSGGIKEIEDAYKNDNFATISAIINKRVHPVPCGAHSWGNRTAEQPLMCLLAASKFYPTELASINMNTEVRNFYSTIYGYDLTEAQATEILSCTFTSMTDVNPVASTTFTPSTGGEGTVITFSGTGWWSSENIISVTVGGIAATNTLRVSASGHLSGAIFVPTGVAKSANTIVITASGSGANTFTDAFTVTA